MQQLTTQGTLRTGFKQFMDCLFNNSDSDTSNHSKSLFSFSI